MNNAAGGGGAAPLAPVVPVDPVDVDLEIGGVLPPQPVLTRQGSSQGGSGKVQRNSLNATNRLLSSKWPSMKRSGSGNTESSKRDTPLFAIPTFLCGVCLENCDLRTRYQIPSCSKTEQHAFCTPCLTRYSAAQADSGVILHLCPGGSSCGGRLSNDDVRLLLASNEESLAHFERFLLVAGNQDYRECPSCQTGTASGSVTEPKITCASCGLVFCFIHANAHPNTECIKYAQKMMQDENEFNDLLKKTTRDCPKCHSHTEK